MVDLKKNYVIFKMRVCLKIGDMGKIFENILLKYFGFFVFGLFEGGGIFR